MSIKDIVNRDNVNLENCDQEPIHIPGTIQPHGCLLALDTATGKIKFSSGNSEQYIGMSHAQLLGKTADAVFNADTMKAVDELRRGVEGKVSLIKGEVGGRALDLISHRQGANLIMEVEQPHTETGNADLLDLSRDLVVAMEETQSLKELCDLVAVNIRKVTGYDRVMVYRFDKDYNGEVLSESKREDLEGFLGLHYPHTDIPAQARELYIRNQLRIIVDMDYVPVPVYTNENLGNDALDMSLSVLRSVSPIHVQYLHNMGVGATLTISLVLRGKLWGLVACHHYSAKYLPYDVRMSTRLLGHFITSQIDSRKLNEEHDVRNKAQTAVEYFGSKKLNLTRSSVDDIVKDSMIFSVCNADGVAIVLQEKTYVAGKTPSDESILRIASQLQEKKEFVTDHVSTTALGAGIIDLPGLAFFSLQRSNTDCVIWFRKETVHDVHWAGDPTKSIEKDKNGLSPRKSFELWQETVKEHSKPWLSSEISAAVNFANIIERHINAVLLTEEEEKQRKLANDLILTNAELENINYISTHDLQEPLRKIQMTASVLLGNKNEQFSQEALEKIIKMNQFAGRMQHLIKDILKYTQLNYNRDAFEKIALNTLIADLKTELVETLSEKNAELVVDALPTISGVPFLIRQLFTNLIHNSVKFSDPSRPCRITLSEDSGFRAPDLETALPIGDYYILKYSDNGLGFDAENNDKIFKIFTRLYSSSEITGSGIGLAICRKIMQTHSGYITAEGNPGVGATFRVYFPKDLAQVKK